MWFFLIPISILLVTHWLIFDFVVRVFRIKGKYMIFNLGAIFLLLAFSFVISAVLARFWENVFTRGFYFASAVWLGIWLNLILAILVFWLLVLVLSLLRINFSFNILGGIFLIGVFLYSAFGIYNVFFPQIKNVTVKIENLPDGWKNKKIVQLTDVHLGHVLRTRFLNRVVKKTNALAPELILITGDLFDGLAGDLDPFVDGLNRFKAQKGVYMISGNHEVYLGLKKPLEALQKTNINILDDDVVDISGLQIVGISYSISDKNEDVGNKIKNKGYSSDKPSVMLYHAPTSLAGSNGHGSMYWAPQIDFSVEQELGIDLQLSGHTHRGQIWPFNLLTKRMYQGYDYGLHRVNDFQIYISSGTGIWGPVMRTGSRSEITVITLE